MDRKQALIILKQFCKSVVDVWFVIFCILGVIVLILSLTVVDDSYKDLLYKVGAVMVFSGSFSALTRWLSVHGLVKKELQDILFSTEYLEDSKRFDEVWEKLVSTSIKNFMPSLTGLLNKDFLRQYLPAENEIFYQNYHQKFDIYWEDKEKGIIKVIETTNITVSTSNKDPHQLKYSFIADYPENNPLEYEIKTLKINNKSRLSEVDVKSDTKEGIISKKITYNFNIEGDTEYKYFRKMNRFIRLDYEPFIVLGSGHHTYRPRVTIHCHDVGIKAYFTSTGTLEDFDTIDGKNNSDYMEEQYPELLMKAQGYSIYFGSK